MGVGSCPSLLLFLSNLCGHTAHTHTKGIIFVKTLYKFWREGLVVHQQKENTVPALIVGSNIPDDCSSICSIIASLCFQDRKETALTLFKKKTQPNLKPGKAEGSLSPHLKPTHTTLSVSVLDKVFNVATCCCVRLFQ